MRIEWIDLRPLPSKSYNCGFCGNNLATNVGYLGHHYYDDGRRSKNEVFIYICHHCQQPSYFNSSGHQTPGTVPFQSVNHLPSSELDAIYSEARDCFRVNAYTATVMCCRKILMNVAVHEGADEGKDFTTYVNYINSKHLVPRNCKFMIEAIRAKGGAANHEIESISREEAELTLEFIEVLLRNTYEYAGKYKGTAKAIEIPVT